MHGPKTIMIKPEITAVVCTRNRAHYLRLCLDSLLTQTLHRDRYEILVVDNASTDSTRELCETYARHGVRYIPEPVIGLSRARNTGWQQAEADYVGYLDDDGIADPSWLESALNTFHNQHPTPACVGGPIRLLWETPEPSWMNPPLRIPLGFMNWGTTPRQIEEHEWLMGGNSFYPKHLLSELGGFDERLGRKKGCLLSGEESQLYLRLRKAGGYLFYEPGVSMRHHVTPDRTKPAWFYRRYFWGGVSDVILHRTAPSGSVKSNTGSVAGSSRGNSVTRMTTNLIAAMGLAPLPRRIQARIYLAYALGWLLAKTGIIRHKLEP
jgi:glycosyltransferase involved in cell wall biosynthesis